MTDYIECDRGKYCKAKKVCPLPKYIKTMLKRRYGDSYICPNKDLIKRDFKDE
jgi:hypothetical protein